LLPYFDETRIPEGIDQLVIALNQAVSQEDQERGCPFKAVSFHGEIHQEEGQLLTWEMIVDV
jgi:RNA 2',3'-cyclic 3'-phosphodiesterase